MSVSVTGFALRGRTEDGRHVVLALDVRLVREIQVAAICLRLTGKRVLQIVVGLGAFQRFHRGSPLELCPLRGNARIMAANIFSARSLCVQLIVAMPAIKTVYRYGGNGRLRLASFDRQIRQSIRS